MTQNDDYTADIHFKHGFSRFGIFAGIGMVARKNRKIDMVEALKSAE